MRFNSHEKGLARSKSSFNGSVHSISINKCSHQLLSCLVGFGLLGCGTEFSSKALQKEQNKNSVPKIVIKEATLSQATFSLKGIEAHRYQAEIKWPEGLNNVTVYVNEQLAFKASTPTIQSCFLGLDDNKDYIIQIISEKVSEINKLPEPEKITVAEWKIKTPLDVVLNSEIMKSNFSTQNKIEIQVNRVFIPRSLSDQPSFISEGRELLILTNELIADDSSIATFQKDQKAPSDLPGRSGGAITIKTKQARGQIAFELRGEHGGDGKNGEPFLERAPKGVKGIDGIWVGCDPEDRRCHPTCSQQPGIGYPGNKGLNGNSGTNGRLGGNSGILKLEIAEFSPEFHFSILKEVGVAGVAGVAGLGGPGQIGGLGGDPGKPDFKCNHAHQGPEGKHGEPGANGLREADGVIQNECVSIGEGFGRCS